MMKVAYFDCTFGAAGDMLCATLLASGLDAERWLQELEKIAIPSEQFEVVIEDVMRCAIIAKKVTVQCAGHYLGLEEEHSDEHGQPHEHGHQHKHGKPHEHGQPHEHGKAREHGKPHEHGKPREHGQPHEHGSPHEPGQLDQHGHPHDHDRSPKPHGRAAKEIFEIIHNSAISERAKKLALAIFSNLAEAESMVHGVRPDEVHFHEVGAIDAIIDIVGFAIAYDLLNIDCSIVSRLTLGSGVINTEHGTYPVPGPAVLNLIEKSGAPTTALDIPYECLTPTGAAILTTIAARWGAPPSFEQILGTGYGAGTINPHTHPNAVRSIIGTCVDTETRSPGGDGLNWFGQIGSEYHFYAGTDQHARKHDNSSTHHTVPTDDPGAPHGRVAPHEHAVPRFDGVEVNSSLPLEHQGNSLKYRSEVIAVIEANIDDCPPSVIAYAMERAIAEGALDVSTIPATMKKGRSGHVLSVLARPQDRRRLEALLLGETSTIGVRTHFVERLVAEREFAEVRIADSCCVKVKVARDTDGKVINVRPEHADCAEFAKSRGLPLKEVLELALLKYQQNQNQT